MFISLADFDVRWDCGREQNEGGRGRGGPMIYIRLETHSVNPRLTTEKKMPPSNFKCLIRLNIGVVQFCTTTGYYRMLSTYITWKKHMNVMCFSLYLLILSLPISLYDLYARILLMLLLAVSLSSPLVLCAKQGCRDHGITSLQRAVCAVRYRRAWPAKLRDSITKKT